MQKIYTVSVYLNIILSFIIVSLVSIGVGTSDAISNEDWLYFIYFAFVFAVFFWLSFKCLRLNKYNTGRTAIKNVHRKLGIAVAVTAIVMAITLALAVVAGFAVFTNRATKEQLRLWPLYAGILVLLLLAAVTAIANAIFYFKVLKKNRLIVNEYINSIGA